MHSFGHCCQLCVCLFVVCGLVSAELDSAQHFHYGRPRNDSLVLDPRGRIGLSDTCSLCVGDENCLTMDEGRCHYLEEAGSIMDEGEDHDEIEIDGTTVIRDEVDALFGELALTVAEENQRTECVPFISYHTDCNKENMCVGCVRCTCPAGGSWNCSQVQLCRPSGPELIANHQVLLLVMHELIANIPPEVNRTKRSLRHQSNVFLEDSTPWMYDDEQLQTNHIITLNKLTQQLNNMTEYIFKDLKQKIVRDSRKQTVNVKNKNNYLRKSTTNSPLDEDNFSFDEILSSIGMNNSSVENNNQNNLKRKKPEPLEFQNLLEGLNEIRESANEKLKKTVYDTGLDEKIKEMLKSINVTSKINLRHKINNIDNFYNTLDPKKESQENFREKNKKSHEDFMSKKHEIQYIYEDESRDPKKVNKTRKTINTFYNAKGATNNVGLEISKETNSKNSKKHHKKLKEIKNHAYHNNIQDFLIGINEIREDSTTKPEKVDSFNVNDYGDLSTNDKENDIDEYSNENLNNIVRASSTREKREINNNNNATDNSSSMINASHNDATNVTKSFRNVTITKNQTDTYLSDLNENIINPLNDIISVKLSEIKELLEVKERIMNFTKANKLKSILSKKTELDEVKPGVSIYKLEMLSSSTESHSRRIGDKLEDGRYNLLSEIFQKFKYDLFELMRDIVRLKINMNMKELPQALRYLMRALRFYIRTEIKNENKHRKPSFLPSDRYWIKNVWSKTRRNKKMSSVDFILDIFRLLDKKLPASNALDSLSLKAKKVLRRVIKELYVTKNSTKTFENIMAHHNFKLLNDLKNIGHNWQKITGNLAHCNVVDKLYEMKRLHLSVSADILKIKETLEFFDFANSRRLVLFEENQGENLLLNIENKILLTINAIRTLFENFNKNVKKVVNIVIQKNEIQEKTHKTKSLLKRLKNLFKSSKLDFFKKHEHRPTIQTLSKLKESTQKKISEYKNILKKWQEKLNVSIKRQKRNVQQNKNKQPK